MKPVVQESAWFCFLGLGVAIFYKKAECLGTGIDGSLLQGLDHTGEEGLEFCLFLMAAIIKLTALNSCK